MGSLIIVKSETLLFICRIFQGICVGCLNSIAPMIIIQLAPIEISGTLGSYYQFMATFGAFVAFVFQYLLSSVLDFEFEYYLTWIYALPIVIVIAQSMIVFFLFSFETPKYLILRS